MTVDTAGDWADTLAEKILGDHCACYAEAWPAHTCANAVDDVARLIRAFFATSGVAVVHREPTEATVEAMDQILDEMRETSDGWPVSDVVTLYKAAIAAAQKGPML